MFSNTFSNIALINLLVSDSGSFVKAISWTRNWPQNGSMCVDEVDVLRTPCIVFDIALAEGNDLPFDAKRSFSEIKRKLNIF